MAKKSKKKKETIYLYIAKQTHRTNNAISQKLTAMKVGVSSDFNRREETLNPTKPPVKVEIIMAWKFKKEKDAKDIEDTIKFYYEDKKTTAGTEWFDKILLQKIIESVQFELEKKNINDVEPFYIIDNINHTTPTKKQKTIKPLYKMSDLKNMNFIGVKLSSIKIKGNTINIKNWQDGLKKLLDKLNNNDPVILEEFLEKDTTLLSSLSKEKLHTPYQIGKSEYYVELNRSASTIAKIMSKILKAYGFKENDVGFRLK
ncbi:MAG: GIY-YIG nuclease family protein [Alphaproteobacteria bacterium]